MNPWTFGLAAFALTHVVFATWPGIDLRVSAPFHVPEGNTWVGLHPVLQTVRHSVWTFAEIGFVAATVLLVAALVRRDRAAVPARVWAFVVAAVLLGPGLLVNAVLKAFWGRVRPNRIEEFGGDQNFTPAFQMAGQCTENCSFTSGEAAMAVTVAMLLWLLVVRRIPGPRRRPLALGLLLLAGGTSFLRVVAGGHFLSDVVFSAFFSVAVTVGLWQLMAVAPAAERLTWPALRADLVALVPRRRTE